MACVILGVGLAALYTLLKAPVYSATAQVLVRPITTTPFGEGNVNLSTERQLVLSSAVAHDAADRMGSKLDVSDVLGFVSVDVPEESEVLSITFTHPDPKTAQVGADSFAQAYVAFRRNQGLDRLLEVTSSLNQHIVDLDSELEKATLELKAAAPGTPEAQTARARQAVLENQIAILNTQLASIATVTIDPGEIIAPAVVPARPSSPKLSLDLALGLFLGMFAGITLAFLRDRADSRVRERTDVEQLLGLPVLGLIPAMPGWNSSRAASRRFLRLSRWTRTPSELATVDEPTSPAAEAYRSLRTSLLALDAQRPTKVILIVSALGGEGKTTTASNLAVTLAHAGKKVMLISADMRRPRLEQLFGVPNDLGLSNVLNGEIPVRSAIKESAVEDLLIMPGGPVPTRPVELLHSDRMKQVLMELSQSFDFVLVDCPPVLPIADDMVLAPYADGILFVARADSTNEDAVVQARISLELVGGVLLGAVLNGVRSSRHDSYYSGYLPKQAPRFWRAFGVDRTGSESEGRGRRGVPTGGTVVTAPPSEETDPATSGSPALYIPGASERTEATESSTDLELRESDGALRRETGGGVGASASADVKPLLDREWSGPAAPSDGESGSTLEGSDPVRVAPHNDGQGPDRKGAPASRRSRSLPEPEGAEQESSQEAPPEAPRRPPAGRRLPRS